MSQNGNGQKWHQKPVNTEAIKDGLKTAAGVLGVLGLATLVVAGAAASAKVTTTTTTVTTRRKIVRDGFGNVISDTTEEVPDEPEAPPTHPVGFFVVDGRGRPANMVSRNPTRDETAEAKRKVLFHNLSCACRDCWLAGSGEYSFAHAQSCRCDECREEKHGAFSGHSLV